MKIQTNVAALNAHRSMTSNASAASRNMERLSSGFRINSAKDDAAGLAIANKLGADVRALQQASRNASQGTAMLQVADGAAQSISSILTRMKELATQANSASIGNQADKLQAEFSELASEIDRIVGTTKYQGTALIDGTFGVSVDTVDTNSTILAAATNVASVDFSGGVDTAGTYTFADTAGDITLTYADADGNTVAQTVTGAAAGDTLNFDRLGITLTLQNDYAGGEAAGVVEFLGGDAGFMVSSSGDYGALGDDLVNVSGVNLSATGLGVNALNIETDAAAALTALDTALDSVNTALGDIGAAMNRIDFAQQNTETLLQNTQAAESTIRDADMAFEMMEFTKNNILQQASQAMLAQANQVPQGILQLLR